MLSSSLSLKFLSSLVIILSYKNNLISSLTNEQRYRIYQAATSPEINSHFNARLSTYPRYVYTPLHPHNGFYRDEFSVNDIMPIYSNDANYYSTNQLNMNNNDNDRDINDSDIHRRQQTRDQDQDQQIEQSQQTQQRGSYLHSNYPVQHGSNVNLNIPTQSSFPHDEENLRDSFARQHNYSLEIFDPRESRIQSTPYVPRQAYLPPNVHPASQEEINYQRQQQIQHDQTTGQQQIQHEQATGQQQIQHEQTTGQQEPEMQIDQSQTGQIEQNEPRFNQTITGSLRQDELRSHQTNENSSANSNGLNVTDEDN